MLLLLGRSATGSGAHGLGFLPTTSHTGDDETRRIDGSVHDWEVNVGTVRQLGMVSVLLPIACDLSFLQLTHVHSALQLYGQCALPIYLLTCIAP